MSVLDLCDSIGIVPDPARIQEDPGRYAEGPVSYALLSTLHKSCQPLPDLVQFVGGARHINHGAHAYLTQHRPRTRVIVTGRTSPRLPP